MVQFLKVPVKNSGNELFIFKILLIPTSTFLVGRYCDFKVGPLFRCQSNIEFLIAWKDLRWHNSFAHFWPTRNSFDVYLEIIIPRRKGGGRYGNSLRQSFRPSVCPSVPHFCPEHISKSVWDINFKLHKWINLIKEACSVQEPLLYLQYFWSNCPLYIFTLNFCPAHISKSIKARNLKHHTQIELIKEKCGVKES